MFEPYRVCVWKINVYIIMKIFCWHFLNVVNFTANISAFSIVIFNSFCVKLPFLSLFFQLRKCLLLMSLNNHWLINIMKSIQPLNWYVLYGMCRCCHPQWIGYMETKCWILIWHAVALGKLIHITFLVRNHLYLQFGRYSHEWYCGILWCNIYRFWSTAENRNWTHISKI